MPLSAGSPFPSGWPDHGFLWVFRGWDSSGLGPGLLSVLLRLPRPLPAGQPAVHPPAARRESPSNPENVPQPVASPLCGRPRGLPRSALHTSFPPSPLQASDGLQSAWVLCSDSHPPPPFPHGITPQRHWSCLSQVGRRGSTREPPAGQVSSPFLGAPGGARGCLPRVLLLGTPAPSQGPAHPHCHDLTWWMLQAEKLPLNHLMGADRSTPIPQARSVGSELLGGRVAVPSPPGHHGSLGARAPARSSPCA